MRGRTTRGTRGLSRANTSAVCGNDCQYVKAQRMEESEYNSEQVCIRANATSE